MAARPTYPKQEKSILGSVDSMRFALLGLFLVSGCSSSLTGSGGHDGGTDASAVPCSTNSECTSGQYCANYSKQCPGAPEAYTVGVGTCHRDCSMGQCSCSENDQADCLAGEQCSSGECMEFAGICISSNCPPGCELDFPTDRACGPGCRCTVCPPADAGTTLDATKG